MPAVPLEGLRFATRRLAKECARAVNHDVHVRCVVAVPGWEIETQNSSEFLLVNERNVAMLTGWKDQRDYLMNEDVDIVQQFLAESCTYAAGQS
jgi:hypothetical protein